MAFHPRKLLLGKPDLVDINITVVTKFCHQVCLPTCITICNDMKEPPPPPPLPPPTHAPHAVLDTSAILVIVLCFLGVAFLFVSYLSIIKYRSSVRNSRRRDSQGFNDSREDFIDENHGPVVDHPIWYIRTVGLPQSLIDSIDVFKFKKGEGLVEGFDCSVCLSEFQEDEELRLLPKCSHAFHIECIDTWLRSHKNCPLCRAPTVNDVDVGRVSRVTVEEANLDGSGSEEGNQVENVSNFAVVGSDEEGGDGSSEPRGNNVEDCTSLSNGEDNGVDEISDKNLCFGQPRGIKVRGKSDMAEHTFDVEMETVRRSISMDCRSPSLIYIPAENSFPVKSEGTSSTKDGEGTSSTHIEAEMKQSSEIVPRSGNRNSSIYNLVKSSSLGRSLQKVPLSMKRSFSSGGKSSLPTHREDAN